MKSNPYQSILQRLEDQIDELKKEQPDNIEFFKKSTGLCFLALAELKRTVLEVGFSTREEEINFFKHIKPKAYSKLIYFENRFEIELKKPGYRLAQKKYFRNRLKDFNKFLKHNKDMVAYFRTKATHSDEHYFLRNSELPDVCTDAEYIYFNPEFFTLHDYTLSKIIAFEKLIEWLDAELNRVSVSKDSEKSPIPQSVGNFRWTESKVALVELIYALHSSKAINDGKSELNSLIALFEKIFNIDLGDYSRTFIDVRSRKKERARFLDSLKQHLLVRMDKSDG